MDAVAANAGHARRHPAVPHSAHLRVVVALDEGVLAAPRDEVVEGAARSFPIPKIIFNSSTLAGFGQVQSGEAGGCHQAEADGGGGGSDCGTRCMQQA